MAQILRVAFGPIGAPRKSLSEQEAELAYRRACWSFLQGAFNLADTEYLRGCAEEMAAARVVCLRMGVGV